MIALDWSQIVAAGALAFGSDFDKGKDTAKMVDIVRHSVLTTILSYKKKYGKEYGDIVLAADGRNYWRREIFQYYKAGRKAARQESATDWGQIFSIGSDIREEINEIFPYKVIKHDMAEGDDVIGVLAKWSQTNDLNSNLMDESPKPFMIISNDGDYKQLHKYKNVRQFNPLLKKLVAAPDKYFLLEKLLTGDAGDGIPNIRSTDDQLVRGVRQPAITEKLKVEARKMQDAKQEIKFADDFMTKNYHRNRNLIDFDYIPDNITNEILQLYLNNEVVKDKAKIFNYFIKNRCRLLMERIQEF